MLERRKARAGRGGKEESKEQKAGGSKGSGCRQVGGLLGRCGVPWWGSVGCGGRVPAGQGVITISAGPTCRW